MRVLTSAAAVCPICDSTRFEDFQSRQNARCRGCGSLERTRYLWLYLPHTGLLRHGPTVLHVAPEKALIPKLHGVWGAGYRPADFDPPRYRNDVLDVARIDLCRDMREMAPGSFDLVMHLHVLEHLPCSLDTVFEETMRILRPGGSFIFGAAIVSGNTIENISPDLLPEERLALFRQRDHVRLLGSKDFPRFLKRVAGPFAEAGDYLVDPHGFSGEATLRKAAIPYEQVRRWTSDALFHIRKRGAPA